MKNDKNIIEMNKKYSNKSFILAIFRQKYLMRYINNKIIMNFSI